MSIADKLTTLAQIKTSIASAIEAKGVTVGSAPFTHYAALIAQIEAPEPEPDVPALTITAPQNGSTLTADAAQTYTVGAENVADLEYIDIIVEPA